MRGRFRASLALVLLALLLAGGYPGALAAAAEAALRRGPDTPGAAGWIHVAHPPGGLPYLVDDQGRTVLLRGVVTGGLVDYWTGTDPGELAPPPRFPIDPAAYAGGRCPANDTTSRTPPLCESDLDQMRALGFNLVRLALSWSLLEPRPGAYDATYLARVHQVVDWARARGLRVILDMHQNAYSRYVGRSAPLPSGRPASLNDHDGAPAWATFTDGLPSEKFADQRELNPAVFEAATNFWLNRGGIQDRYLAALARLAREFRDDPTVLGYSPFNEPWPGWVPPPAFDDLLLFPFYRRVIDAVTGAGDGLPCPAGLPYAPLCGFRDLGVHDVRHLFFLETGLVREITDFPTRVSVPVSSYPNLVLGLHAYTHIYTVDRLVGIPPDQSSWPAYDQSYWWGVREAAALGAAVVVTEFGDDPSNDSQLLAAQLGEQDRYNLGSAFWVWKENCGYGLPWGLYAGLSPDGSDARCAYDRTDHAVTAGGQGGCLRARREALLGRGVPLAVPAGRFEFGNDDGTGAFRLSGRAARPGTLVLELPARAGDPAVTGGRVTAIDGGAHRTLTIALDGGDYSVTAPGTATGLPSGCA